MPTCSTDAWPRCGVRLVVILVAVGAAVLVPAAALGWGDGGLREGTFFYFLIYLPLTWPLHLAAVALTSRRARHPRRWAVGLAWLLALPLAPVLIAVAAPGVAAIVIAYLLYAATMQLPAAAG